jgi:hypothetical protein
VTVDQLVAETTFEQLIAQARREGAAEAVDRVHAGVSTIALQIINETVFNEDIDDTEKVSRIQAAMRTWLRGVRTAEARWAGDTIPALAGATDAG